MSKISLKSFLQALLVLILALSVSTVSYAGPGEDAQETVKSTFETVSRVVDENNGKLSAKEIDTKLQNVLLPVFDFDEMSRGSLGASWKTLNDAQRQEFKDLFASLLARTYLHRIRTKVQGAKITFSQPMTNANGRVTVRAKILSEGDSISADYRMYQKDGKWRIYDAIVENVGLVTNYRSEFANLMNSQGYDGLIKKLRDQTQKLDTRDAAALAEAK